MPNVRDRPPMPVTRIVLTTKRLLSLPRSTCWIIFRPETAMKPYRAMHTPPITQPGMELTKATNGEKKLTSMARMAVARIVTTEALRVMATQATDSP